MTHNTTNLRQISSRGFTLLELCVILVTVSALFLFCIAAGPQPPLVDALEKARANARQLKDSTQIRGIQQALVVWAGNDNGKYPLPSVYDTKNQTVADVGSAKNTTANIFSLLIFNGNISPEICISPAESNKTGIIVDKDYELSYPKTAVSPADALWDPAFRADFSDPKKPGNLSYAHLIPGGEHLNQWSDTFVATEAVLGNRGPEVASVEYPQDQPAKITWKNEKSNTFLIHGEPTTWEGNIAYNDNHVEFHTSASPAALTYIVQPSDSKKKLTKKELEKAPSKPDVLFYDEPDDAQGQNLFLSIFTAAGDKPSDFKAIWD